MKRHFNVVVVSALVLFSFFIGHITVAAEPKKVPTVIQNNSSEDQGKAIERGDADLVAHMGNDDCSTPRPSTFAAACEASKRFKAAYLQMDELYTKQLKRLETQEAKDYLQKSQRAWLIFRNKACAYEAITWLRGTGTSALEISCQADKMQSRIEDLKSYLNCSENGCPN